jgi:hypothetical protein
MLLVSRVALKPFGGGKTGMRKIVALVVLIVLLGGFGIEVGARAYRLRQCNRYAKVAEDSAGARQRGFVGCDASPVKGD